LWGGGKRKLLGAKTSPKKKEKGTIQGEKKTKGGGGNLDPFNLKEGGKQQILLLREKNPYPVKTGFYHCRAWDQRVRFASIPKRQHQKKRRKGLGGLPGPARVIHRAEGVEGWKPNEIWAVLHQWDLLPSALKVKPGPFRRKNSAPKKKPADTERGKRKKTSKKEQERSNRKTSIGGQRRIILVR